MISPPLGSKRQERRRGEPMRHSVPAGVCVFWDGPDRDQPHRIESDQRERGKFADVGYRAMERSVPDVPLVFNKRVLF